MHKGGRIKSVDFLRGLTVAGMILVNNPGSWSSIYSPLKHASWNGCTPTDLIFPFFLFIVGISIAYAFKNVTSTDIPHKKIWKRTALLFLFGLFLNFFPEFEVATLRIPGVLQRISIVFLVASYANLYLKPKQIMTTGAALLVCYWIVMCFIPNPQYPTGMLEPGKNFSAWIDYTLLPGHLWQYSITWDPEGILSTLPALVNGLIGVLTGHWMMKNVDDSSKTLSLFIVGSYLILAGLIWHLHFPINKSIWTSSYVLVSSGVAIVLLALVYFKIDVSQQQQYTEPFMVFGSNAIAAYMLSEILADVVVVVTIKGSSIKEIIFNAISYDWLPPEFSSLVFALAWVGIIYLPMHIMYRKKIFLKV